MISRILLTTGVLFCHSPVPLFAGGWKEVWHETFDADRLDGAKWRYETGFVRNRELQYYTDLPANVRLADGKLILEARHEPLANPNYDPAASTNSWTKSRKQAEYTSGSITTKGKFDFCFGKLEVRAKVPKGVGVWPAIWLMGINGSWPACGEIDVMEFVGWQTNAVVGTLHYQSEGSKNRFGTVQKGATYRKADPTDGFHVYGMEWDENRLALSCDGECYFDFPITNATFRGRNPFKEPQYLKLNLAVGGAWAGKYGVDNRAFPARFEIDDIRVLRRDDE